MNILIPFIVGYLLCAVHAYLNHRAQERRYAILQRDCRKVLNEFSIRTNGRAIFKSEQVTKPTEARTEQGEYAISLPSMFEDEADTGDDGLPEMSEADLEHLRNRGVVG